MRRMYIDDNLDLWKGAAYSSGGYISNCVVTSGSQQQFYIRNTNISSWDGGVWNMVFQGVENAPHTICPGLYTTIQKTPVIAEKPFISIFKNGSYQLIIPQAKYQTSGTDFNDAYDAVYVTDPGTDNAVIINEKLKTGIKHIVFSAGIYYLDEAISIIASDTVLLGIGFPTLIPTRNNALIEVSSNIHNIRLAGLLLQSGTDDGMCINSYMFRPP
eukprot:23475_1